MKISLEWLSDYLPGPLDPQVAADALTNGGFPVESIEHVADDTVLDVEVTSNRGDCLSHIGVARELSALLNRPLNLPATPTLAESLTPASSVTNVTLQSPSCSLYTARILRNVKVAPSPSWLVRRLQAVGLRTVNNIVDITNYVLMETGQPLHAFDYDQLADHRIIVRDAQPNETLTSIDGHARALRPGMMVIADARQPVALAGIMGGLSSEVSPATTTILLEAALFDALNVRSTSRALALHSDASYRFERGLDPTVPARASLRAAELILQLAGGELLGGLVSAGNVQSPPRTLTLRLGKLKQVLGIDIPADQAVAALARLGFNPALKQDQIHVTVPSHRLDINIEVDLVEEVIRVIGYDNVPVRDEISIRLQPPDLTARTIDRVRSVLVSAGYFESVTFSWVSDLLAGDFIPPQAAGLPHARHAVRKADGQLRPSLLPGLLESVRRNESTGTPGARLFEIGATFYTDHDHKLIERRRIGLVGSSDLREVRGVVETILTHLNPQRSITILPADHAGYAKGAAGRIEWDGQTIGHLGRIDPAVIHKLSLREHPVAAELDLTPLLDHAQHVPQLNPLPRFPAIERDLSLIVTEATPYAKIEQTVLKTQPPMLESLRFVTTYRGKPLEKGQKSVTITLIFRSLDSTLSADQVEPAVQKIIASATADLGATLRA